MTKKKLVVGLVSVFTTAAFVFAAADAAAEPKKVRVDLHVMSKCPFQAKLMQAFVPVFLELEGHVDLHIEYIGRDENGELTSMHGEEEVLGDILQLCAHDVGSFRSWVRFVQCQSQEETWRAIPQGWEQCAKDSALNVGKLRTCYQGPRGRKLLKQSFATSKEAKAVGSPTIFVDGAPYKGGRSTMSIARAICARFDGDAPAYCATVPKPARVPVTIIGDERCTARDCDTSRFGSFIANTFEGAVIEELDFSATKGRKLFEKSGEEFLPIAVFGPEVAQEEQGFDRLKTRLKKLSGSDSWVYPLGRSWDPSTEICDDGEDNTGNGKIDCADPACAEKVVCRKRTPRKLDLFMMSQCPYAAKTVQELPAVLEHFRKDRRRIDLELNYVGSEVGGKLTAMHGPGEVEENLRQICAQKHFAEGYRFMDYVVCRAMDYRALNWRICVPEGMDAEVIEQCATGDEGQELLRKSYAKTNALEIKGSPSWLLNNRHEMKGRKAPDIIKAFCKRNKKAKGCKKK